MQKKKDLRSFLREEDGKTVKKSLLIASLGLVAGFSGSAVADACSNQSYHTSGTGNDYHASSHCNHYNHSSY